MLDRLTIERIEALSKEAPIVVAVSGGGDSMALLHLLCDALGRDRFRAVIVDHALRPGSAEDAHAAHAAALPLAAGAKIVTLTWPGGLKISQQAARTERYKALCAEARACGARVIAPGQTLDDQIETIMMRAAAGSTWRGLTGMAPLAPAPLWPEGRGLLLARPLLDARRAALRELLTSRGVRWIEDPANTNPAYERVRVRTRLAQLEAQGFDARRIAALARALRPFAERLDSEAAALIGRAAAFEDDRILVRLDAWKGPDEVLRRALSALITAASGSAREPGRREVERLAEQLASSAFRGASLGGAVLSRRRDNIEITRDRGALEGRAGGAGPIAPMDLPESAATVWDGRLELCARRTGLRVLWGGSGPILEWDGKAAPLSDAVGAVDARWLLEERVKHVLHQEINGLKCR